MDTDLVDGRIDGQKVDEVCDKIVNKSSIFIDNRKVRLTGAEGIFTGKSDFNALGLDKVDDFNGSVGDVGHVLAVRVFAETSK